GATTGGEDPSEKHRATGAAHSCAERARRGTARGDHGDTGSAAGSARRAELETQPERRSDRRAADQYVALGRNDGSRHGAIEPQARRRAGRCAGDSRRRAGTAQTGGPVRRYAGAFAAKARSARADATAARWNIRATSVAKARA